jgi:hypothetical protein
MGTFTQFSIFEGVVCFLISRDPPRISVEEVAARARRGNYGVSLHARQE